MPKKPFPRNPTIKNLSLLKPSPEEYSRIVAENNNLEAENKKLKASLRSLQEKEERLSGLMEYNPSLLFLKDEKGRYVYMNKTYQEQFVGSKEWFGKSDYHFWPKKSAKLFRSNDRNVLATGRVNQFIEDSTDFQGTRYCWLNYKFPFTDSRGCRYVGGIGINITDRILAEEALRQSEGRLRALLQASSDVVYRMDPNFMEMYELIGRDFLADTNKPSFTWAEKYIHSDDQAHVMAVIEETIRSKSLFELEHRVILKDGSLGWTLSRAIPILDDKGKIIEWFGAAKDITDRKMLELRLTKNVEALTRLHALSTDILDKDNVPTLLQDIMDTAVSVVSAQFGTLHLLEKNSLRIVVHHGHDPAFLEYFTHAEDRTSVCGATLGNGQRIIVEDVESSDFFAGSASLYVLRAANIRAIQSTPLVSRSGKILGILTTQWQFPYRLDDNDLWLIDLLARQAADLIENIQLTRDLRMDRDELDRQVRIRTEELQKAHDSLSQEIKEKEIVEEQLRQCHKMEAIGTLAGGIAHDFNNILAAILGFTEMALDDVADRPDVEHNLRNVLNSVLRARDLVRQILTFSRKTKSSREPISLGPVIKETVKLLRASIPANIEIIAAIDASPDIVVASTVEIQQIIMNLATNASLAMEGNGGLLQISLSNVDRGNDRDATIQEFIQICVKDTGKGMSAKVMKRIFEPFYTTRQREKGTGMGLAVVYGIVQDLHGSIAVESKPGKGSIFRVDLPVAPGMPKDTPEISAQELGGTENILFVDDEPLIVEWARSVLVRLGYNVEAVNNPAEALEIFRADSSKVDLVITDLSMPGLTGKNLAKELLAVRPDIPIILCTGHGSLLSSKITQQYGIKKILTKPLSRQELGIAVRELLENK